MLLREGGLAVGGLRVGGAGVGGEAPRAAHSPLHFVGRGKGRVGSHTEPLEGEECAGHLELSKAAL